MLGLFAGMLGLIALVAIVGGFLHYRRERLLTHAERMKALELGRTLHLDVVAEGVEHPAQVEQLARMGCRLAQGYYYSRPQPAREMGAFLREQRGRDAGQGEVVHPPRLEVLRAG